MAPPPTTHCEVPASPRIPPSRSTTVPLRWRPTMATRAATQDWEATFARWYRRASDAEQTRYENTCKAINAALRGDARLAGYTFDVYPKGSYPAFTNVVRDSDVD